MRQFGARVHHMGNRVAQDRNAGAGLDGVDGDVTAESAGSRYGLDRSKHVSSNGVQPRAARQLAFDVRDQRLKRAYPALPIAINGGIASVEQAAAHLAHLDGVMIGRAAYQEPWRLLAVDPLIYGVPAPNASSKAALEAFIPYVERELARGRRLHAMTRHILGLFQGVPGARAFRRHIATHAVKPGAGLAVLREALGLVVDARAELAHIAA